MGKEKGKKEERRNRMRKGNQIISLLFQAEGFFEGGYGGRREKRGN